MNKFLHAVALIGVGIFLGWILAHLTDTPSSEKYVAHVKQVEKTPLYWVAPMDPNYRRDQPGKSPMGMDLVPVYEAEGSEVSGMVKISPEVVNNLGVRTAPIEFRALNRDIKTVGYVNYDENTLLHIHPRTEGWIETLYIKSSGEPVTAGQALYSLYSPTLVNAQEELLIAMERGNQRLIRAAEERLNALKLPSYAIKHLKNKKQVNQTIVFFAPRSGIVDHLNVREGFFIKPAQNIMSIGSLEEVWVEAEVFERQAPLVQVGAPVTMTLDYLPGSVWRGAVDYIYPVVDAKNRAIKVRMRFLNEANKLKPNMFAEIVIHGSPLGKTLVAPKSALIRSGNMNRLVLALGDGRFQSIKVEAGRFDEEYIEILTGVKEGDHVVTSAQFLIDSESSKTADFVRMQSPSQESIYAHQYYEKAPPLAESAEVKGVINSISVEDRIINISHGAIKKWKHPVMSMDFKLDDKLAIDNLEVGMDVNISFVIRDGYFLVTHLFPLTESVQRDEQRSGGK